MVMVLVLVSTARGIVLLGTGERSSRADRHSRQSDRQTYIHTGRHTLVQGAVQFSTVFFLLVHLSSSSLLVPTMAATREPAEAPLGAQERERERDKD